MNFGNLHKHIGTAAAVLIALALCAPVLAHADDELERNREVSYLVFQRAAGFNTPTYESNFIDATITVRFRRMPQTWLGFLEPQLTDRKRRFFKRFEELRENGKLAGFIIHLGIGTFTLRTYVKRGPYRWVLRIGESRTPPFTRGPWAVPIVPYADMIEEEADSRPAFVRAEMEYMAGALDRGCPVFQQLRMTSPEVAPWAAIREADCLIEMGQISVATDLLKIVAQSGGSRATRLLARVRLGETTGRALVGRFFYSLYAIDPDHEAGLGTIADEVRFRAARIHLFRAEIDEALKGLEALWRTRPTSPFVDDDRLLQALRWRALSDATADTDWLKASRIYVNMPTVGTEVPHWARLHLAGATAFEHIGLPQRAIELYLYLLRQGRDRIREFAVLSRLAQAYHKNEDTYRAQLTLDYLTEHDPQWRRNRDLLRLKGDLALIANKPREASRMAVRLLAQPKQVTKDDARLAVETALTAIDSEGLAAARALIAPAIATGHALPVSVAEDLALAASDCDLLARAAQPIELATAKQLLWTAACLSKTGRIDEAIVYLLATETFAAEEIADPDLWPLVELIKENTLWWKLNEERLAPQASNQGQSQSNTNSREIVTWKPRSKPARPDGEVSS